MNHYVLRISLGIIGITVLNSLWISCRRHIFLSIIFILKRRAGHFNHFGKQVCFVAGKCILLRCCLGTYNISICIIHVTFRIITDQLQAGKECIILLFLVFEIDLNGFVGLICCGTIFPGQDYAIDKLPLCHIRIAVHNCLCRCFVGKMNHCTNTEDSARNGVCFHTASEHKYIAFFSAHLYGLHQVLVFGQVSS